MKRSDSSRLVYSTEAGRHCPQCLRPRNDCVCGQARPAHAGDGIVRLHRETKGRGGKAVTLIKGLTLPDSDLKQLASALKQRCGTGGSLKDGIIEIQGDRRELLRDLLTERGFTVKIAGG